MVFSLFESIVRPCLKYKHSKEEGRYPEILTLLYQQVQRTIPLLFLERSVTMEIFLLPTAPDIFVLAYKVTLVASERWGVLAFFNRHLLMFFLREDFYIRQANH